MDEEEFVTEIITGMVIYKEGGVLMDNMEAFDIMIDKLKQNKPVRIYD